MKTNSRRIRMKKSTLIVVLCYLAVIVIAIPLLTPHTEQGDGAGHGETAAVHQEGKAEPAHEAVKAEAAHPSKDAGHQAVKAEAAHPSKDAGHQAVKADAAHPSKDANPFAGKPSPDQVLAMLKEGNLKFAQGNSAYPHLDQARLIQAGSESQGKHAYATVISCSDSRVPVEAIFDAGIMDIFVIRVAGNVCDVDERGSIEYGLAHVHTPVLVVLGHTQCGAVTAVTQAALGHGHALERNIPPLVDNIQPAVMKAMADHPDIKGEEIIPYAIVQNIWTGMEELFMESPTIREFVAKGWVKVIGAVYDVGTGVVEWLPEQKTLEILLKAETNPAKAMFDKQDSKAHHG
jgi:carbonic anhydrase